MVLYVALGDSYAAGVGAGSPVNACYRDKRGYPPLVAQDLGADLVYAACSGAVVANVMTTQVPVLSSATEIVTITVGGNDVGFVEVVTACAKPAWLADGEAAIDAALVTLRTKMKARLERLYKAVVNRAPNAQVVVTGYPRLFNGVDCNLLTFFNQTEMRRINEACNELDVLIRTVATSQALHFVDVRGRFTGHAVCSSDPFIHGLTSPVKDSFHPTTKGHSAYAEAVVGSLPMPAMAPAAPGARAPQPTTVQAPVSETAGGQFSLPDLLSPQSLRAAERAGLDRARVAELARRLPTLEQVVVGKAALRASIERDEASVPRSVRAATHAVVSDVAAEDAIDELRAMSLRVRRNRRRAV